MPATHAAPERIDACEILRGPARKLGTQRRVRSRPIYTHMLARPCMMPGSRPAATPAAHMHALRTPLLRLARVRVAARPGGPHLHLHSLRPHSPAIRSTGARLVAPAAALTGAAASLLGWAATQRGWGGRGDLAARSQRGPAAARLGVLGEMQSDACGPHAPPPAWRVGSACSCRARLPAALSMPAARCAPAAAPPPRHDRPCRAGGLQSSQRHAPAAWPNPR